MPGHGACFRDHRAVVDRRLRNQEHRAHRLLAAIPAQGDTVGNLARVMFPGLTEAQLFLGLSETLAHLDVLQDQHLVTAVDGLPARYCVARMRPDSRLSGRGGAPELGVRLR
jgi:hypothetical protein